MERGAGEKVLGKLPDLLILTQQGVDNSSSVCYNKYIKSKEDKTMTNCNEAIYWADYGYNPDEELFEELMREE